MEKSLVILKPDIIERNLESVIKGIYLLQNFKIEEEEYFNFTIDTAREFYREHEGKHFYESLCGYMISSRVLFLILSGDNAISRIRNLNGKTNPQEAEVGTIRHSYAVSTRFNSVHASSNQDDFNKEYAFFKKYCSGKNA